MQVRALLQPLIAIADPPHESKQQLKQIEQELNRLREENAKMRSQMESLQQKLVDLQQRGDKKTAIWNKK